jgi:hypothetical protein
MKSSNESKLKRLFVSTKFAILIGCLLIVSLYVAVTSFLQPSNQSQTTIENTLQQKTAFSYLVNVQPSELYPQGGIIEPDSVIFEKVTNEIPTTIQTSITSEQDIKVEGSVQPILTIEAGEFWKKDIPLSEKEPFQFEGKEYNVINRTFSININEVKELIKSIEEEINVSPDNYLLKVNPNITGTIIYAGKEISLNGGEELVFEYGYNKIQLASEKEFKTETPFKSQNTIENPYNLLGFAVPAFHAKVISIIVSICLIMLLLFLLERLKERKLAGTSEAQKIDKKHASRLVTVSKKFDLVNKSFLTLESFTALTQVADEKELPIFRYEDKSKEKIVYFIIDLDYIFSFEANNLVDTSSNTQIGSDVSYG